MATTVLIGAQWGDEGKGKVIDVLTKNTDIVVRFQGGNNAGHTVEFGGHKYILHLVPSGIFHKDVDCVIGNGLVVDPIALKSELEDLQSKGCSISRFHLSDRAHLIFSYHKELDALRENNAKKGEVIGTTKKGIGPAYADKAYRTGIRAYELLNREKLKSRLNKEIEKYNKIFSDAGCSCIDFEKEWKNIEETATFLAPFIHDTIYFLNTAIREGKNILMEGAQGTLLDIDFGTYPFVTSSNTTVAGACTGAGIPPKYISNVIGIIKAYNTRVGEGPFPTELHNETGEEMRKNGHEFGATTGRPRRCGWFDAVLAKYSCMINGIDELVLTKLDVLDTLSELQICIAYEIDGKRVTQLPSSVDEIVKIKPVYKTFNGWNTSTKQIRKFSDLPKEAKEYIGWIEEFLNTRISIISVGPDREQTFKR